MTTISKPETLERESESISRTIRGAVLVECGRQQPYSESAPLEVWEMQLDSPGPTEVLVKIEAAGVCHSDMSVINGSRPREVPMLLGHESCGIVTAVGSEVHDLEVGTRVVMVFMPRCGDCKACQSGGRVLCTRGTASNGAGTLLHGGTRIHRGEQTVLHHSGVSAFAEFAVVDRVSVVPIPSSVPPEVGALLGCAVLTGGGALRNAANVQAGESVAIFGAGGVGMAALLVAKALGAGHITVIDPVAEKRELALSLGADDALHPEEVETAALQATVVVEATGNARAFESALEVTEPGGRLVPVGLAATTARASISPLHVVFNSITVIGSYLGSGVPAEDIPFYASLWEQGLLPVEKLVSHEIGLDEINEAFDRLAEGASTRQVIRF